MHWEEINHDNGFYVRRAKVYGGWLVSAIADAIAPPDSGYSAFGSEFRVSITYVPDPEYKWEIECK